MPTPRATGRRTPSAPGDPMRPAPDLHVVDEQRDQRVEVARVGGDRVASRELADLLVGQEPCDDRIGHGTGLAGDIRGLGACRLSASCTRATRAGGRRSPTPYPTRSRSCRARAGSRTGTGRPRRAPRRRVRFTRRRPGRARSRLHLHNCPEYLEACFAAFKLRAVPVNVNYRYRAAELAYLLDNADADGGDLAHVARRRAGPGRGDLAQLRAVVEVDDGRPATSAPGRDAVLRYDDLLAGAAPAPRIGRSGDDARDLVHGRDDRASEGRRLAPGNAARLRGDPGLRHPGARAAAVGRGGGDSARRRSRPVARSRCSSRRRRSSTRRR